MQSSFQIPSGFKIIAPLDVANAQNQDKFKIIIDRMEERIISELHLAAKTNNALSMHKLKQIFAEAKGWVK